MKWIIRAEILAAKVKTFMRSKPLRVSDMLSSLVLSSISLMESGELEQWVALSLWRNSPWNLKRGRLC